MSDTTEGIERALVRLAAVEALADEWQARYDEGRANPGEPLTRFVTLNRAAARLRATLAPAAEGDAGVGS